MNSYASTANFVYVTLTLWHYQLHAYCLHTATPQNHTNGYQSIVSCFSQHLQLCHDGDAGNDTVTLMPW